MTEHQANLYSILSIAIAFPLIGVGKLFLARVMAKNTRIRTNVGSWLVRMFVAIGFTFIFVGCAYAVSLFATYQWFDIPLWGRWTIRILAVVLGLVSLLATSILVKAIIPILKEVEATS